MSIFKCKMCGGNIEFEHGASVGTCDHCGTKQTLPKLDDDKRANLYDRANHFRRNNEYDKAAAIYEQILNEDGTDAEAYWSLVLCRYGVEYVEDPATKRRVPTVNRAQFTSVFADEDYRSAINNADAYQKGIYEAEAKAIDEIQKGILAISQKEEPFDVFICYKETDNNGRRTPDSVLATELYHQLTQEGFKVFFSRITLEDKLGTAYEPYIFAALNSAKVMVVLGTKPEYFNAVWVKNEWSRYLALVKKSGGKKMLIPAYKDMDPYDLPEEFSHLQAQDMSKLGFMQDLIRGIKKIIGADEPKAAVKETVVVGGNNANVAPLLERAFLFLEDGKWEEADEYCEKVLDQDPRNARAYLGKLMAENKCRHSKVLANCLKSFETNDNYLKIMRFGDDALKAEISGYVKHIQKRNYDSLINEKSRDNEVAETLSAHAQINRLTTQNKKKKSTKLWLAMLGIAIGLTIIVLGFLLFFDSPNIAYVVPNFVGQYYSDVVNDTQYTNKFVFIEQSKVWDDKYEEGQIISQSPKDGTEVTTEGYRIYLMVSKGVQQVEVPDVAMFTFQAAKAEIQKANLTCVEEKKSDDNIPEGLVIGTYPNIGTQVNIGEEVVVYVSTGSEASDKPIGTVIAQSPDNGTLNQGDKVDLTISDGTLAVKEVKYTFEVPEIYKDYSSFNVDIYTVKEKSGEKESVLRLVDVNCSSDRVKNGIQVTFIGNSGTKEWVFKINEDVIKQGKVNFDNGNISFD